MIIKDDESVDIQTPTGPMRRYFFRPAAQGRYPGLILFQEIFQVGTDPAHCRDAGGPWLRGARSMLTFLTPYPTSGVS